MAEVFLCKRAVGNGPDELLALKRTLPQFSTDPDFVTMFRDEAKIARSLDHPNICRVCDVGEYAHQLYIAMEFIHGKDLRVVHKRALARGEAIPYRLSAFIVAKIARALDYAHGRQNGQGGSAKIVHRDVSPHNILISYDGVPKLIDFGIARAEDRLAHTQVGVVKGKCAYVSPEQATGSAVDGRSDIFSLGVVLYELVTGVAPFRGESDLSTLKRIVSADYAPPQHFNKALPPRLVAVIGKALARSPEGRYARAADMAADLDCFVDAEERPVTEEVVSAFMRKLFRDDYIRETASTKKYLAAASDDAADDTVVCPTVPPRRISAQEVREPAERDADAESIPSSSFLAAGYDAPFQAETEETPVPMGITRAVSAATPRRSRAGLIMMMGAALLGGAAVFAAYWLSRRG